MIRKATEKDIPAAMELFTAAKSIMRSDGNSTVVAPMEIPTR